MLENLYINQLGPKGSTEPILTILSTRLNYSQGKISISFY